MVGGIARRSARRPILVGVVGALLVGVLELAPPVLANAVPTTDPINLSSGGADAGGGRVAFDPAGTALIVWSRIDTSGDSRIQLRTRSAAGSLGTTVTLSAAGRDAMEPQIAVDATGNALITWKRFDGSNWRVQVVRRSASGSLSGVQTVSPSGQHAESPQIAVAPDGTAYMVWLRWDGSYDRVELRRRSPGGTLGSVVKVSPTGDAADPQVAVDANGNAYIAWKRSDGSNDRVQMRRRSAGGTLGSVATLSGAGQDARVARLSIDPSRNVFVVWQRYDGSNWRIELRRRSAGGTLDAVVPLSDAGQDAANPQVATSAGGALVAWERSDGSNGRIQVVRRSSGGTFSSVQTVSAAGQTAESPYVGIDAAGNGIIAWRRWDGANYRVQVVRRASDGSLGEATTLSAAGQHAGASGLAMDFKGNGLLTWGRSDGTNVRVQGMYVVQVQQVSDPGTIAGPPAIAVDATGNALLAWWRQPYLDARRRSAAGSLGALHHLTSGAVVGQNQQIAFDADGNASIVWVEPDASNYRIKFVRRTASGAYGPVRTLSAAGQDAGHPQVAVDSSGRAYVVWARDDGSNNDRIQLRRVTPSGTLSTTQTLSPAGRLAVHPQVAVDGTGNAIVVWELRGGVDVRIQLRRRSASGTLGSVVTLSAAGQDASEPRLAMDPNGNVVVVWQRPDGTNVRVQAVRRTASGALSAVKTVSPAGQDALWPDVAVAPDGSALIVWVRSDGSHTRIELVRRAAGGTLGSVQAISPAGQDANVPDVAIDGKGRAVIAWTRWDGLNRRLQAIRRSAGGTLGAVLTLSPAGENAGEATFNGPVIAMNKSGKTVLIACYTSAGTSSAYFVLRF